MARTIAKDHDQKRARILDTAARVFATEGFDRASMTQLARECGISKANIYHYYDGKQALLFDVLDSYLRDLRDRICIADEGATDPETRFRQMVGEILHAYQGADHYHKVQMNALSVLPDAQRRHLRGYQRQLVEAMAKALADVAPAAFAVDADRLRATTMSVFGMLNWFFMWNTTAGASERDDYAKLVAELTLDGVRGSART